MESMTPSHIPACQGHIGQIAGDKCTLPSDLAGHGEDTLGWHFGGLRGPDFCRDDTTMPPAVITPVGSRGHRGACLCDMGGHRLPTPQGVCTRALRLDHYDRNNTVRGHKSSLGPPIALEGGKGPRDPTVPAPLPLKNSCNPVPRGTCSRTFRGRAVPNRKPGSTHPGRLDHSAGSK